MTLFFNADGGCFALDVTTFDTTITHEGKEYVRQAHHTPERCGVVFVERGAWPMSTRIRLAMEERNPLNPTEQ